MALTKDQALRLKPGDTVIPHPTWNKSTWGAETLPREAVVLKVREGSGQTGALVTVRSVTGKEIELDAGWFL